MGMRAQKVNKFSGGKKRIFGLIVLAAVAIFFLCGIGTALYAVLGFGGNATQDANEAMDSIYATMTMEAAARAQIEQLTAQAPTPLPTEEPTLAIMPTSTFAATQTSFPTKTPIPMILPTREPIVADSSACNCAIVFECADFSSHDAAQACFNSCGAANWSDLDNDGDGVVCVGLP